jgi:ABC-type multidrug transport system fused ATPase/permease subunit
MNNLTTRAPLLFVLIMVISIAVISLFAVAIQAGWEMMVLLVLCALALSTILLWFSRGVTATGLAIADKRLSANAEQHRHIEAVLKLGHSPKDYTPIERQIAAPAQAAPVVQLADPRREHALRLLNATLDSDKYGPRSTKIMTQKDAGAVGIIADDWSAAVAYLFLFGVATGNTGTIIKDSRNVSRLMADVARDKQDNEASAVMGLPEVGK